MIKKIVNYKMIKSEDLNHHGTLFAGRCSEWFVESAFITAGSRLDPKHIVCLKVHGLEFLHPMRLGSILGFESRIVHAGHSTMTVYTQVYDMKNEDQKVLDGFVTFCNVDDNSRPTPHGITIELETQEEKDLNAKAAELVKRRN